MRQLLTWRLIAALGALALLAYVANAVFSGIDKQGDVAFVAISTLDENGDLLVRKIDLVESIDRIEQSPDFGVAANGLTMGFLDAVLDQDRTMRIAPGTPGEVTCVDLVTPGRCAVAADVLGDAVVWFAIMPIGDRDTVEFPPIVDLQDGYAQFVNGWELLYAPVIERDEGTCPEDVVSFSDFLRRFGPGSTTLVDLETQRVVSVTCGEEFVPPPTGTSTGSLTGAIVVPTTEP